MNRWLFRRSGTKLRSCARRVHRPLLEALEPRLPLAFPQQKFITPLAGTPHVDWTIAAYVDVNPTPGAQDFTGGGFTFDGHPGLDFALATFSRMDAGVPVFAVADGTVVAVSEVVPDRVSVPPGSVPGNSITIAHPLGFQTIYSHLRRDSVMVAVGQNVTQGQIIGLVGSSGQSPGPRLGFTVLENGLPVETYQSPTNFWVSPVPYTGAAKGALDFGVTNDAPPHLPFVPFPALPYPERPSDVRVFPQVPFPQNVAAWVVLRGVQFGDAIQYVWRRPDNSVALTQPVPPAPAPFGLAVPPPGAFQLPPFAPLGTWRVEFIHAGIKVGEETFDVSTVGAPEVLVTSFSTYITDGRRTPIDFGNGGITDIPFTVFNHGSAPLTTSNLSVPPGFEVFIDGLAPTIPPGGSDTFNVRKLITTPGYKYGEVRFDTNDANEGTFNFLVEGFVPGPAAPEVMVQVNGVSLISNALTPIDFGTTNVGLPVGPRVVVRVRNTGSAPLVVGAASLPLGYSLIEGLTGPIAAGQSDTFTVQLDTLAQGTWSGPISFINGDADESPFTFLVTGQVGPPLAQPEIFVETSGVEVPDGSLTSVFFGVVGAGSSPPMRFFTVVNTGATNLTLGSISLPSGFTLVDPLSATIPPSGFDTFIVQMDTSVQSHYLGELSFTTNDADENPFNFPIEGRVVAPPEIVVELGASNIVDGTATPVDFGPVLAGQPGPTRVFTVRNTGQLALTLGSVTLPAGYSLVEPLSTSIAGGLSDTFTVRLDTASPGVKTGQLSFSNNDPNENPFNFPLIGAVLLPPEIVLELAGTNIADGAVAAADFGTVNVGAPGPTLTFTVRNTGGVDLALGLPLLPSGFTLVEPLSTPVAGGGSDTFTVRMETATAGLKFGDIVIGNNDADENPFNFQVFGLVNDGPEIVVELSGAGIADGTATAVDFGSVIQGQAGVTRIFTVRNTGPTVLTLGAVNLPAGFSLVEGLSASIASAASDTFTVQLDSAVAGTKSGQLSFTTSDADENPFNFPLAGLVLSPPEIVVELGGSDIADGTAAAVDFGSVTEGQAGPTRVFTVRNSGGSALSLGVPSLPTGYSLVDGLSASLAAGVSDTFTVRLDSAQPGTKAGQISFSTSDADENPFNFPVTGVVTSTNTPPTISDIADRTIDEDGATGSIGFVIGDAQTPPAALTITRQSSNTALVPLANIVLGGTDAVRTLSIAPSGDQFGTATITITVHDASGGMASDSFLLTVNSVNDLPTISAIADRQTGRNTSALFAFDVGDIETAPASLSVQVQSSNPALAPTSAVVLGGSGVNRTATITPTQNLSGVATITLIVSDGNGATASEPFTLTVGSLWQNSAQPLNVDGQPGIVPLDVLIIFNELNNRLFTHPVTGQLPAAGGAFGPAPYYDVDGDEFCTPLDALLVLNHINAERESSAGEGEAAAAAAPATVVDLGSPVIISQPAERRRTISPTPPPLPSSTRAAQQPLVQDGMAEDLLYLLASDVAARRRGRFPRAR